MLKHGQIVEQGDHDSLLQIEDGHYRNLWEKQSEQQERLQREIEEKKRIEEEFEQTL